MQIIPAQQFLRLDISSSNRYYTMEQIAGRPARKQHYFTVPTNSIFLIWKSFGFRRSLCRFDERVVEPSKSRSAGMLAAFFLVIGLCSGIGFTYLEAYLMENVGPLTPVQIGDATGDMCAAFNRTA
ncbi:hypothetical protein Tcan_17294 [Toxocara canis]|uniref:Uncharacterized protein n=1 Tax=Toxocara canis TaxID=6265 RepID=A0A0B2VBE7_TOXCA|nr:hypothetical protein Tcan_17294 [Toxocara canis]